LASTSESQHAPPLAPPAELDWLSFGIAVFSILIIAALWFANHYLIEQAREQRIAEAKRINANLARTFEEHAVGTFDYIEDSLLQLKRLYETKGVGLDLPHAFREMSINPAIIVNAVITDATGMVVLGSHGAPHVSLADREHVKVHFKENTNHIFIGKPVRGRVNKQWSIVMSVRANHPDGTLAGVIAIAVDPFYFSNFFKDLDLGTQGAVAFVGLDGIVRARLGGNFIGTNMSMTELLRQARLAPHGAFVSVSATDNVPRIYAYRLIRDTLLIVSVGTSINEVLADTETLAHAYGTAAWIVTAIIIAFAAALIAFGRRHQRDAIIARSEIMLTGINRQLRRKASELTEANRELEAFSYSVSHDLRAPLRHIIGYGSLLVDDNLAQLDQEGRNHLARIIAAGTRMNGIIDDLLRLAQLSRHPITLAPVNLSTIASEVRDDLLQSEPARPVTFDIAPGLIIHADAGLMRTVMENLMENAWKYSARVPIARIEVGSETNGRETVFHVRDNGAGFDMAYAENLFKPFQRMHSATDFPGTGIGLATVRRIIMRHFGRIWVESAVGVGTTVFFAIGDTSRNGAEVRTMQPGAQPPRPAA
jgi:signal transduction histidine kinase